MYNAFGAPADYLAAFGIDGQLAYPERRMYIEAQGWLTPNGQVPGNHSEHIHTGLCWPVNEEFASGPGGRVVHVRHTFHNVQDYTVTGIRGSLVDRANSQRLFLDSPAQVAELDAAAKASAGATIHVYQTYPLATANSNGFKELRFGLTLEQAGPLALVPEWFTDARAHAFQNYDGLPYRSHTRSGFATGELQVRNCMKGDFQGDGILRESYHYGGFCEALWPVSIYEKERHGNHTVIVRATNARAYGSLHVNPNFHRHPADLGLWHQDIPEMLHDNAKAIIVPLNTLDVPFKSVNNLVLLAHEAPESATSLKPISTAVFKRPIRVR